MDALTAILCKIVTGEISFVELFAQEHELTVETALGSFQCALDVGSPLSADGILAAVVALPTVLHLRSQQENERLFGHVLDLLIQRSEVPSLMSAIKLCQVLTILDQPVKTAFEAAARCRLAEIGVEPEQNYRRTIELSVQALERFAPASTETGRCRISMAMAWTGLAELGVEPERNLCEAIGLYREALKCFRPNSRPAGICQMNEATARARLAPLGVAPDLNLLEAIRLCREALKCFGPDSTDTGSCQMNEASALQALAELGVDPKPNILEAIRLCQEARKCFASRSREAGSCRYIEANAWQVLAEIGVEPERSLREAIRLYKEALQFLAAGFRIWGRCCMNEGIALGRLADLAAEPERNLREAIEFYRRAEACFAPGSPEAGHCHTNEATARLRLAKIKIDPEQNLRAAENLAKQARDSLDPRSISWARACGLVALVLKNEGRLNEAYEEAQNELRVLDSMGGSLQNESSRRGFREVFSPAYQFMVSICLDRAAAELTGSKPNPEAAEALRWEAWKWVRLSKARTLQESVASFREAAVLRDPSFAFTFDIFLRDYSRIERRLNANGNFAALEAERGAMELALQRRVIRGGLAMMCVPRDPEIIPGETVSSEELVSALGRVAGPGRRAIVVEFFQSTDGQIGAFVHPAGEKRELDPPLWFEGKGDEPAIVCTARLARQCLSACEVLSHEPRGVRRGAGECPPPSGAAISEANKKLESVARELGEMLTPLRDAIAEKGWHDATLILCPTGRLHLLPLAAAHWTGTVTLPAAPAAERYEAQEIPRALIDVHPIVQLPTAGLAMEVAQRELNRPQARTAYVAAADPFEVLDQIYPEAEGIAQTLRLKGFDVIHRNREQAVASSLREHGPEAWIIHLAMHTGLANVFDFCGVEFHDRRLLILELLSLLRFKKAALAIVATCSSSQPLDLTADDPSAVTRAWMLAGATSVIGGLWPLVDERAKEFSLSFYRNWATGGKCLADAVQKAMLEVRDKASGYLYDWAPFILVGSGATRLA